MDPLQQVIAKQSELVTEQKGLFAKADVTDEDLSRIEAITEELKTLDAKRAQHQRVEEMKADNARREAELNTLGDRPTITHGKATDGPAAAPALVLSRTRLQHIKGEQAHERAYKLGQFFLAAIARQPAATEWCRKNGVDLKVHTESNDQGGGFLVPTELDDELIVLREQFGVFRQFAKRKTMKADTRSIPRRKTGLTAYFQGEAQTIQESMKGWDRVGLTAKKLSVLAKYSNDLAEDAIIDIGDDLAGEISYAFAKKEDDCGFNGTGDQSHGAILGVLFKMATVFAGGAANNPGVITGSGNGYALAWNFLLKDFTRLKGALPQYADTPAAGWFCHKLFFHTVMEQLMLAAGGTRAAEVAEGRREPLFLGYPVHFSQILPSAPAQGQIPVVFGDLSLAATFGDRRQTTIAMSEHLNFAEDEIAIRGTERFDINVHDVGDTVNNLPGPLVGLLTPNA